MPHPTEPVVVRHPQVAGLMVALDPATDYATDDPLYKAYKWAFEAKSHDIIESISVEQATARPGEKRATPRRKTTGT